MTGPSVQPVGERVQKLLLNAEEAAQALSISPRTLWKLTKDGAIKARRVGKRVLYHWTELQRFAESTEDAGDGHLQRPERA